MAFARQVMTKTAEAHGCSLEVHWREPPYPPTVNDKQVSQRVSQIATQLVGQKWLQLEQPSMGGEDFSFLAREIVNPYVTTSSPQSLL